MKTLTDYEVEQRAAVLREYANAVRDKNTELALRILRANPDIFGGTNESAE